MMNIKVGVTVDASGAIKSIQKLRHQLEDVETIGKILHYAASVLWIKPIKDRLEQSTGTSAYEYHLDRTMLELDPAFVGSLKSQEWANQQESERRLPGGYKKGQITKNIERAIKASNPMKGEGYIAVGIADLNLLNSLAGKTGTNAKWEIWRVLQFGSGIFNPYGHKAVVRTGNQVFFSSKTGNGVATHKTVNPGFRGREYFVRLDGDIHRTDFSVRNYIMGYMRDMVKKYSY